MRMRMGGVWLAAWLATAVAWLACKDITSTDEASPGGGGPAAGAADTITVVIENFTFRAPNGTDSITIAEGQSVRFVNRDAAPHTASSTDAPAGAEFDSGQMGLDDVYVWTPTGTGTWVYRCDFHPTQMAGAVVRVGESAGPPPNDDPDPPDDGGGSGDVTGDTIVVDILDFSFRGPDGSNQITVEPGQTVLFINRDQANHTATSTGGAATGFDSGDLDTGESYAWTAPEAGTWTFVCEYHDEMIGTLRVSDGSGDEPPAGGTVSIEITDSGFVGPNGDGHVTIDLGDTVEWVNTGSEIHTASATDVPDDAVRFDSDELAPGASFAFTPDRPGLYEYRCDEHSHEPEGTITVQ